VSIDIALVAHPSQFGRSMRTFLPFKKADGFRIKFYHPRRYAFDRYLPLLKIDGCEQYQSFDALRDKLQKDKPDMILMDQPLDFGMPDRVGFLFHGVPWASGRTPLTRSVSKWWKLCRLFFCGDPGFALHAIANTKVDPDNVLVTGLVQNDYILSLDRAAMRERFLKARGWPNDMHIILYVGHSKSKAAPLEHHKQALQWLEQYIAKNANALLIVKPKVARFQPQQRMSRVVWAHKGHMVYDSFFADAVVSFPVGTTLSDSCIADVPVALCEMEDGPDEVRAKEFGIGPVARSAEELAVALDELKDNPQKYAWERGQYLKALHPLGLDGNNWKRVLESVRSILDGKPSRWRVHEVCKRHEIPEATP